VFKFVSRFFCFLILGIGSGLAATPVHLVWDIDGTLVDYADDVPHYDGVFEIDGHRYLAAPGAEWIITEFSKHPMVASQHFYSGGDEPRNLALLTHLKATDQSNRSLLQIIAGVLSRHHLVDPVTPTAEVTIEKMLGRHAKKDLRLIHPNLDNIILIDDWYDFTPDEQRENILTLGKSYTPYTTYAEAQARLYQDYDYPWAPRNHRDWLRHRYRLVRAYNIIMESLEALGDPANHKTFRELVIEKKLEPNVDHVHRGLTRISTRCTDLFRRIKLEP
jgi:hypothetical protein